MYINFSTTVYLDDIDNHHGIQPYFGEIFVYGDDEKDISVGEIEAYIISPTQATEEEADSVDGSVYDVVSFLIKHDYLEGIAERFGHILFIDSMEIKEDYRKKNIGLNALYRTCKILGASCGFAIILPCPLYCDENTESGRKKLQKHWSKLGFERVKRSNYFFLDLAYELQKPPPIMDYNA